MNKIILIGRLTDNPQLASANTPNGPVSYCNFTIAVNRNYGPATNGKQNADFINCIAWRGQAENLCKFMKKGSQIALEGSLQISSYDDQQGIRRTSAKVLVAAITFCGSAQNSGYVPEPNYPNQGNMNNQNNYYGKQNNNNNYNNNYNKPNNGMNQSSPFDQSNQGFDDMNQTYNQEDSSAFKEIIEDNSNVASDDLPF